jgi:hypothetical protein
MMHAVQSFQLKIVFENKHFDLRDIIERSKAAVQTNPSYRIQIPKADIQISLGRYIFSSDFWLRKCNRNKKAKAKAHKSAE